MAINSDDAFELNENGIALTNSQGDVDFYLTSGGGTPHGSPAPVNTFYIDKVTNLIYYKFGATDADWRQICAADIAFFNTMGLYRAGIDKVSQALVNIREQRVSRLEKIDVTGVSIHILTNDDFTFHEACGTNTGFTFRLPDATNLIEGQEFEFSNDSDDSVIIEDGALNSLLTLNQNEISRFICIDNTTVAGQWVLQTTSTTATGISSYSIGSAATFSTTSATDVLVTSMTETPVSGRYGLWFSGDITISQNNKLAQVVTYVDGVAVERTRRTVQGVGSNFKSSFVMVGEITVNGSEQVDVRVNIESGSLDVNPRRLLLVRLGA